MLHLMEGSHAVGNSGVDEGVLRNGIALDSKREGAQATANDKRHHDIHEMCLYILIGGIEPLAFQ